MAIEEVTYTVEILRDKNGQVSSRKWFLKDDPSHELVLVKEFDTASEAKSSKSMKKETYTVETLVLKATGVTFLERWYLEQGPPSKRILYGQGKYGRDDTEDQPAMILRDPQTGHTIFDLAVELDGFSVGNGHSPSYDKTPVPR